MAVRLFLFYVLALTIVVCFVPWTQTGSTGVVKMSPFVSVLTHNGIAGAAGIMNFVVLSAALSSMNTNVYLCSRMLFSLSRGGFAPAVFGRLTSSGTPVAAILLSGGCILLAASVSRITPLAYSYLFGIALFGAIVVWMIILLSHIRFRSVHPAETLSVRMPLFPYMQIAGLVLLAAILVTMGLDTLAWSVSWLLGVPWLVFLTIAYFIWRARSHALEADVGDF